MREYRVGQDIVTSCGKCKLSTWHVVFAMAGPVIKRVQCKQCGSYHNYKPEPESEGPRQKSSSPGVLRRRDGQELPAGTHPEESEEMESVGKAQRAPRAPKAPLEPGATPKPTRRSKVKEEPDYEALWNEALKGHDLETMAAYRADANYEEGAVLNHPLFGVGIITRVNLPPEKRMTVIFRDGTRQLACRMGS